MRVYKGVSRADGLRVVYETFDAGRPHLLTPFAQQGGGPARQGMAWGTDWEACLYLASVILGDCLPRVLHRADLEVAFAVEVLSRLPFAGFDLTSDQVEGWYCDRVGRSNGTERRRAYK